VTRRKAPLCTKRVAPLYGAKRLLPIVERSLTQPDPDAPVSATRRYTQSLAEIQASDKRLGAEGVQ
jgi:hypothetical protein